MFIEDFCMIHCCFFVVVFFPLIFIVSCLMAALAALCFYEQWCFFLVFCVTLLFMRLCQNRAFRNNVLVVP